MSVTPGRLSMLMIDTGRLIRERLHGSEASGQALSPLHFAALWHVRERGRPLMKELAADLRIAPPSATPLIDGLAKAGLLKRTADRSDRRAARLAITPRGRRALSEGCRRHAAQLRQMLSVLTPSEREQLGRILRRLADAA